MIKEKELKRLSDLMLLANLFATLFYSMSYPYIYAEIMKVINHYYISSEQIISCISIIAYGWAWNKYGDYLFKHYLKIVVAEIIGDVVLFSFVIITGKLNIYFLINLLVYAIITRGMCGGGIRMRAKVNPTEQLREHYDNNANSINAIATIGGTLLSCVLIGKLNGMFICAFVGNIIDNIFYIYIYNKIKRI